MSLSIQKTRDEAGSFIWHIEDLQGRALDGGFVDAGSALLKKIELEAIERQKAREAWDQNFMPTATGKYLDNIGAIFGRRGETLGSPAPIRTATASTGSEH
jgi:hypothetical protein